MRQIALIQGKTYGEAIEKKGETSEDRDKKYELKQNTLTLSS